MSPSAISTHNLKLCPIQPEQYHIKTYPLELHTIRCLNMEKKERETREEREGIKGRRQKEGVGETHIIGLDWNSVTTKWLLVILISFLFWDS